MSRAMVCDQCAEVLCVNDRGDSETGEEAGWLVIKTTFAKYDVCTRACALELLNDADFIASMEAGEEVIAEIVRTIKEDDGE